MIKSLEHIGIAVRNINATAELYTKAFGAELTGEEEVPSMKVRIAFLRLGPATVELVEPMGEGSPLEKFLNERGEGLHHICFSVDNIEETLASIEKAGLALIDEKPRIGAHGRKIAFIHPKSTSGVLIELSEE